MYNPADGKLSYTVHCDESWTDENLKTPRQYFVFHGLMVREDCRPELLKAVADFKTRRGLCREGKWVEVKWDRAEKEAEEATRSGKTNRYEEFLDIFFDYLKRKAVNFGCMYLPLRDYERVKNGFCEKGLGSLHDYFFMLYFQFLYHCLVKNQGGKSHFQIYIDNRDLGPAGAKYDPSKLAMILNKKTYLSLAPKTQPPLSPEMRRQLVDLVQWVTLAESKEDPLIQLSDLSAGCIRYVLENNLPPPRQTAQLGLFDREESQLAIQSGRHSLAMYFYKNLRGLDGYQGIDLLKPSWHHRVNIFPFLFR
jgi:hypothetical protein